MKRILSVFLLLLAGAGGAQATEPDLVLRGKLSGADHQTYRKVPFAVPAGVRRITVEFEHTGKEERSAIDLGLLGPDGALRGWSGSSKRLVTISAVDATASYLPTPIVKGKWALLLGVPNLREGATASYSAKVYFSRTLAVADEPAVLRAPLRVGAAWYRGDLHLHTAHSDGNCATQSGAARTPCPLFLTTQAAAARQLDFAAITEHNNVAHANALRELQPYYDRLLLTGRELTTFSGHANFFGSTDPLDFRVGGGGRDWNALLAAAQQRGLLSVNHPVRPSGELCMGCGWDNEADLRHVQAIEAVNGADADSRYSGVPFWHAQLQKGLRITAIGGSDDHNADSAPAGGGIGRPTTVVYAPELSQLAIRAGQVFVDVSGSAGALLELTAQTDGAQALMGDALRDGEAVAVLDSASVEGDDVRRRFEWHSDGRPHWFRVEVRNAAGRLMLLGNPIYINAPA